MTNHERIELIEQAMILIEEAQALVDVAVEQTCAQPHYEAYGKYGFNTLLGNGNPYDSGLNDIVAEFGG